MTAQILLWYYVMALVLLLSLVRNSLQMTVSGISLCPTHNCVKKNTVFTLAFNIRLFNFPLSTCCSCVMPHCGRFWLYVGGFK